MLLITLLFGSLKKLTEVSQFSVEMATPDVPTIGDDDLESRDLAKKTFELVQQLSTWVQSLEAAASSSKDSAKRPRERHSDSGDKSEEEEDLPKDKKAKTFIVSSPTKAFLQSAFCLPKPLTNSMRRNLLEKFGLPEGNEARCPKLDPIIKGELPKEAIDTDKKLSRLQSLALDATGPLVHALEELSMKDTPDADVVLQGIQEALVLLGNASCRISGERRSRALTKLNPDLKSMAEEEDYTLTLNLSYLGKALSRRQKKEQRPPKGNYTEAITAQEVFSDRPSPSVWQQRGREFLLPKPALLQAQHTGAIQETCQQTTRDRRREEPLSLRNQTW